MVGQVTTRVVHCLFVCFSTRSRSTRDVVRDFRLVVDKVNREGFESGLSCFYALRSLQGAEPLEELQKRYRSS